MAENFSNDLGVEDLLSSQAPTWLWDGERGRIYWANDAALRFWSSTSLDDLRDMEFDHAMPALRRLKKLSLMDFSDHGRNERLVFWTGRGSRAAICNCLKLDVEGFGELLLLRAHDQDREEYSNGNGRVDPQDVTGSAGSVPYDRPRPSPAKTGPGSFTMINGIGGTNALNGSDDAFGGDRSDPTNGQISDHRGDGDADQQAILLEIARQVRAESKYLDEADDAQLSSSIGPPEGHDDGSGAGILRLPGGGGAHRIEGPIEIERLSVAGDEVEFLAKISHEVRTPLNSILGFSELMMLEQFGSLENEKYAGYVSDIHESAQLALSLINDLLSLSKMNAGQIEQNFEEIDLNEVARIALSIMRPQAEKGGITLKAELSPDLVIVDASLRSLKQIFLNLLSNAIKFTPSGGSVRVITGLEEDDVSFVKICDTGPGMTPSEIVKAMQPYAQLDTAPRYIEGTGLGLPITSALVEANGGTFRIESVPGEGTEISLRFAGV